jgi:hypothetical protein
MELDRTRGVSAVRAARSRTQAAAYAQTEPTSPRAVAATVPVQDSELTAIVDADGGSPGGTAADTVIAPPTSAPPTELLAQMADDEPASPARARAYVRAAGDAPHGRRRGIIV